MKNLGALGLNMMQNHFSDRGRQEDFLLPKYPIFSGKNWNQKVLFFLNYKETSKLFLVIYFLKQEFTFLQNLES